jgi:hypothetical protein
VAGAVSRTAARRATLVAVPLALLAGLGAFAALGGFAGTGGGSADRTDGGDRGGTLAGAGGPSGAPTVGPQATGPVTVAAPPLRGRAELVCRALLARLPDSLRDRARRPVTEGAEQNAAYGDPPIITACGGPGTSFPPTDLVYALDRVCWHAAQTPTGTVWTTVDREVPVRVTVPGSYREPGQWVIELSAPVIAAVPAADDIPTGCNP